jgi:hypothetical protein
MDANRGRAGCDAAAGNILKVNYCDLWKSLLRISVTEEDAARSRSQRRKWRCACIRPPGYEHPGNTALFRCPESSLQAHG